MERGSNPLNRKGRKERKENHFNTKSIGKRLWVSFSHRRVLTFFAFLALFAVKGLILR